MSYFDLVLTSDLAMLTSYINEMLYLGKETILQHYQEYESLFQGGIPTVCGQMERYLETSNTNTTKIQLHTTSWIFLNYEKVKAEIAVPCIPNPFV
ncbi:hypothetical protein J437_LFUL000083 [Ladona fulva]|uniref:Uncharacterized protein n=1 Tax=Ladona fulva TaxID=123851 RepID=A0A8K0K536_LADFU|nr:hypothetical protein J437_LFUL000083 [Ladona fulva]